MSRIRQLQAMLGFQVVLYLLPSLMHRGLLIADHQHRQAATAESLIAMVLFVGLLGTLLRPRGYGRSDSSCKPLRYCARLSAP